MLFSVSLLVTKADGAKKGGGGKRRRPAASGGAGAAAADAAADPPSVFVFNADMVHKPLSRFLRDLDTVSRRELSSTQCYDVAGSHAHARRVALTRRRVSDPTESNRRAGGATAGPTQRWWSQRARLCRSCPPTRAPSTACCFRRAITPLFPLYLSQPKGTRAHRAHTSSLGTKRYGTNT